MKNEKLDQEYSFDLRPASMEEAGLFYSNDEQDEALGTVGHLRLDFGHGFLELRSTGYPHNDEQFDTLEFKMLLREFLAAMQENGPLESLSSMEDYCQKHGGAITEDGQTYGDAFVQWCKQVIGLCLTAFLQSTILIAGLMVFRENALLGLGLMLSANEVPRIAGTFGLDTTTRSNIMSAVYTAQAAVNTTRTIAQAVAK